MRSGYLNSLSDFRLLILRRGQVSVEKNDGNLEKGLLRTIEVSRNNNCRDESSEIYYQGITSDTLCPGITGNFNFNRMAFSISIRILYESKSSGKARGLLRFLLNDEK